VRRPEPCPLIATIQGMCDAHAKEWFAKMDETRGTRQQRGYDAEHDRTRKRLLPKAWGTFCPLCGDVMVASDDLSLDHTVPLKVDPASKGDRIVHTECNLKRKKKPPEPSTDIIPF
jgi:5-methylcytosine-specific restriction endonuclease McrA